MCPWEKVRDTKRRKGSLRTIQSTESSLRKSQGCNMPKKVPENYPEHQTILEKISGMQNAEKNPWEIFKAPNHPWENLKDAKRQKGSLRNIQGTKPSLKKSQGHEIRKNVPEKISGTRPHPNTNKNPQQFRLYNQNCWGNEHLAQTIKTKIISAEY